jgi:hypothetical protein
MGTNYRPKFEISFSALSTDYKTMREAFKIRLVLETA